MFSTAIFRVDLIRNSRRLRHFIIRVVYALGLLMVMGWIYAEMFNSYSNVNERSQLANFAAAFFITFAWLQLIGVVLMTPGLMANIIAEERQRRTIDYLLTSELSNFEIVMGKLMARLLYMTQFLIVSLPILAILQLLGGIETESLLLVFALGVSTMVFIACVSLLISATHERTQTAIGRCYFVVLLGLLLPFLLSWVVMFVAAVSTGSPSVLYWYWDVIGYYLFAWNPFYVMTEQFWVMAMSGQTGRFLDAGTVFTMIGYHAAISAVCVAITVYRLRRSVVNSKAVAAPKARGESRRWWRFQLSDTNPMFWKEMHLAGSSAGRTWIGWFLALLGPVLWLGLSGFMYVYDWMLYFQYNSLYGRHSSNEPSFYGMWVITSGVIFGMLACLVASVRGASSVASERERDTWLSLIASPLSGTQIVWAKIAGALWGTRWLAVVMALLLIALIPRDLQFMPSLILFPVTAFTLVFFFAALGVRFSLTSSTSTKAIGWTLAVAFTVSGLYLMCCMPIFFAGPGDESLLVIFSPCVPFLLSCSLIAGPVLNDGYVEEAIVAAYVIGTVGYLIAAFVIANSTAFNFDELVGRVTRRADGGLRPYRQPSPPPSLPPMPPV
jgi:ABC-type transport system involved in multi-copper enzyme maturation permease subunit